MPVTIRTFYFIVLLSSLLVTPLLANAEAIILDCHSKQQTIPKNHITNKTPNLPTSSLASGGKWIAFTLQNTQTVSCTRWLQAGSYGLPDIKFYAYQNTQWRMAHSGPEHAASTWDVQQRAPVFAIELAPKSSMDIYLWAGPHHSSLIVAPSLWEPSYFQNLEAQHAVIDGAIYGAMLLLVLTSLSLALIYRAPTLAFMALGVGFYSLYTIVKDNYLILHVWPDSNAFNNWLRYAFLGLMFAFANRYVCRILKIRDLAFAWSLPFYFAVFVFFIFAMTAGLFSDVRFLLLTLSLVDLMCRIVWIPAAVLGYKRGNLKGFFPALLLSMLWLQTFLIIFNTAKKPSDTSSWLASSVLVGGFLLLCTLISYMRRGRQQEIKAWQQVVADRVIKQEELESKVTQRTQELHNALVVANTANKVKTDFLARVSHDLRSPLTVILGYAQLINDQESSTAAKKAGIITKSGRRLLDLVNDLIGYAESEQDRQNISLKPTYALSFLQSIAEEAKFLAQLNNNDFIFEINGSLPAIIQIDHARLHRVLLNLLSNACKFTQYGRVSFLLDFSQTSEKKGELRFTIADTGPGIAEYNLQQLFDPFVRLKETESTEGLGLGLAIAKQWTTLMNGELTAKSTVGEGTDFFLTLPVAIKNETEILQQEAFVVPDQGLTVDGKGKTIWLVEDSEFILEYLQSELESYNFTVQSFWSGAAVMTALTSKESQAPDLLITDFNLPQYNGDEIAKSAKQRWDNLPVFLISAGYIPDVKNSGLFDAILLKPVELAELRKQLALLFPHPVTHSAMRDEAMQLEHVSLSLLNENEMTELDELLSINAISDIMHWCEMLAEEKPQLKILLDRIWRLANDCDLEALHNLSRL